MQNLDKLYRSLVVSGAMLVTSCGAPVESTRAEQRPKISEPDCASLCTGPPGRESFCPDPNNEGVINCCWLMGPEQHACCESEVELEQPSQG